MRETTITITLAAEVHVTRQGWNNITSGTKSKRRSIPDKIRRMKLLPQARYLVQHARKATYRTQHGQKYAVLNGKVRKGAGKVGVTVVLKQDKLGEWIFYSVYPDKK